MRNRCIRSVRSVICASRRSRAFRQRKGRSIRIQDETGACALPRPSAPPHGTAQKLQRIPGILLVPGTSSANGPRIAWMPRRRCRPTPGAGWIRS
jgi:hypothetical protein